MTEQESREQPNLAKVTGVGRSGRLVEPNVAATEVRLDTFDNHWFLRGRTRWVEAVWLVTQALFVRSWLPGSFHRRVLLRLFGAKIGKGVQIKPGLRVKFPWKLSIGSWAWIGEDVWIDNLALVEIESHCCVSQGAYLCTGSHDWTSPSFDLIAKPIAVGRGAWIGARACIGPGVRVGTGAVIAMGSVATRDVPQWTIYRSHRSSNELKKRVLKVDPGADLNIQGS